MIIGITVYSYNRPKVHHLRTVAGVQPFPALSSLNRTVAGVQTFPALSSSYTSKILFLYFIKRHVLHRQSLSSISSFDNLGNSTHQHEISLSHEKLSPHSAHFLFINHLKVYSRLY